MTLCLCLYTSAQDARAVYTDRETEPKNSQKYYSHGKAKFYLNRQREAETEKQRQREGENMHENI